MYSETDSAASATKDAFIKALEPHNLLESYNTVRIK